MSNHGLLNSNRTNLFSALAERQEHIAEQQFLDLKEVSDATGISVDALENLLSSSELDEIKERLFDPHFHPAFLCAGLGTLGGGLWNTINNAFNDGNGSMTMSVAGVVVGWTMAVVSIYAMSKNREIRDSLREALEETQQPGTENVLELSS